MPSKIDQLLFEIEELLVSVDETWWSSNVRRAKSLPRKQQAERILQMFGGMGSFNDLILCEDNGHSVAREDEDEINRRLRELQSDLFDLCTSILEEE